MSWWTPRKSVPVFEDAALEIRGPIHGPRCPARANPSGQNNDAPCRCLAATFLLQKGMAVRTLAILGRAELVEMEDSGPFWIEAGLTRLSVDTPPPSQAFVPLRRRPLPPDYLAVQTAMSEGRLKLPRRRRPIRGGEICFIRSDPDQHPWRYFGIVFDGIHQHALVIDAILRFEAALMPGWEQQQLLCLERDGKELTPEQVLYPVFPLPDKTEDPGWTGE